MPIPTELLVGIETADDAAVYQLNDEQALIATTDFFMPIVDDPYDFGRIAATNAISDVYAMGGRPIMALALVGMPINVLSTQTIGRILEGGDSVCRAAGIPIAGGHTIDSVEAIYGLVALGLVHPKHVKRNADAQPGDVLVLGKPLGVGVMSAALKKDELGAAGYARMIATTTKLNTPGPELAALPGVHALTDVTGFGLAGHALEMARGARCEVRIDWAARAADDRRARTRRAGLRHRRLGAQLGRLRRRRRPAGGLRRRRPRAADRPADQRRPAGGLHAGIARRGARHLPAPRLRPGRGGRRGDRRQRNAEAGRRLTASRCGGRDDTAMSRLDDLSDLTALDADALSTAIHARRVSCREVMSAYLERIHRLNPRLNAIVNLAPDDALLRQADERDAELAQGRSRGWLHGIPQAIKDASPSDRLPEHAGLARCSPTRVPARDSVMAARMKAAGCIVIGKTNLPEFGLGSHTFNELFGATPQRLGPGGQRRRQQRRRRGGAGAARCCRWPTARDFMGSLRNPAAWNNVFGLRPSQGRVPYWPAADTWVSQLGTEGPMARTVRDLAQLLSIQAGHDPRAPLSIAQTAAGLRRRGRPGHAARPAHRLARRSRRPPGDGAGPARRGRSRAGALRRGRRAGRADGAGLRRRARCGTPGWCGAARSSAARIARAARRGPARASASSPRRCGNTTRRRR